MRQFAKSFFAALLDKNGAQLLPSSIFRLQRGLIRLRSPTQVTLDKLKRQRHACRLLLWNTRFWTSDTQGSAKYLVFACALHLRFEPNGAMTLEVVYNLRCMRKALMQNSIERSFSIYYTHEGAIQV